MIKSKYTMIMLKLIEANDLRDRNTINIEEEFKERFLEGKGEAIDDSTPLNAKCGFKEIESNC